MWAFLTKKKKHTLFFFGLKSNVLKKHKEDKFLRNNYFGVFTSGDLPLHMTFYKTENIIKIFFQILIKHR